MIDDDLKNSSVDSDGQDESPEEISKSQRKREADSIRDLGARLAELGPSELAGIPLPDEIVSAIGDLNRIRAHGARKRQLGYLAKRMRQIDVKPIDAALEKLKQAARANTKRLHLVENWRDRMLGDIDDETEKEALTAFLHEFVSADRQHFRHLQRLALMERQAQRSPAATRQLFKAIKDIILPNPGTE